MGTSGWSYDDWDGTFYPDDVPRSRWFEHYATVLPTVEINYSFYRLPRASTVQGWHDRAPRRFRFAVKGSRFITHNKKLADPDEPVRNVTERMAPLKTYLGVWLWQLPPNLHKDVPRLDRFLGTLPGGQRHAVEFRHGSWWGSEVIDVLTAHGAAFVWLSARGFPDDHPITADFVYLRFHGLSEDRYRHDYSGKELEPWADRLTAAAEDGLDGFVYFNNDYEANAPRNAQQLIERLGDLTTEWP